MKKLTSLLFLLTAFATNIRADFLLPKHYELEQLLLISAIGIDEGENDTVKLTLAYSEPSETGEVALLTASGKSISEAINNASSYSGRSVFLGHVRTVIIGKDIAESGVTDALDYLMRSYETRANALVITASGKAGDMLAVPPNSGTNILNELDTLLKSLTDNSLSYETNLGEMMAGLADDLLFTATPYIETVLDSENEPVANAITGSAIFNEGRLLSVYTEEEAFLFTMLRNKSYSYSAVCELPEENKLSIKLSGSKSDIRFQKLQNGKIGAEINLSLRCTVTEASDGRFDTADIDRLSLLISEHYREKVREFISVNITINTDAAHFEDSLRRFHPILYNDFSQLSDIELTFDAKCRIENSFVIGDR